MNPNHTRVTWDDRREGLGTTLHWLTYGDFPIRWRLSGLMRLRRRSYSACSQLFMTLHDKTKSFLTIGQWCLHIPWIKLEEKLLYSSEFSSKVPSGWASERLHVASTFSTLWFLPLFLPISRRSNLQVLCPFKIPNLDIGGLAGIEDVEILAHLMVQVPSSPERQHPSALIRLRTVAFTSVWGTSGSGNSRSTYRSFMRSSMVSHGATSWYCDIVKKEVVQLQLKIEAAPQWSCLPSLEKTAPCSILISYGTQTLEIILFQETLKWRGVDPGWRSSTTLGYWWRRV